MGGWLGEAFMVQRTPARRPRPWCFTRWGEWYEAVQEKRRKTREGVYQTLQYLSAHLYGCMGCNVWKKEKEKSNLLRWTRKTFHSVLSPLMSSSPVPSPTHYVLGFFSTKVKKKKNGTTLEYGSPHLKKRLFYLCTPTEIFTKNTWPSYQKKSSQERR